MRYYVILILLLSWSCDKEDVVIRSTVTSVSIESIGDSLYFTAKIVVNDESGIQKFGFAVGSDSLPETGPGDITYQGHLGNGFFRVSRLNNFEDDDVHYCRPFLKTMSEFVYGDVLKFYGIRKTPVEVNSFAPKEGFDGDFIKIYGSGFGSDPDRVRVFFGSNQASVESMSSERIVVKVPEYKISEPVPITVYRGNELVEPEGRFKLLGPHITSIDPTYGFEDVTVNITGDYFSDVVWRNAVSIGPYSMEVLTASTTQLTARINTRKLVSGLYPITVTVNDKAGVAEEPFTVLTPWQLLSPKPDGGLCLATQFVIGSKIYTCTGIPTRWNVYPSSSQVWEYDMISDKWSRKADFPGEARVEATGFSIDGKGYLATGYTTKTMADLWEYNPSIDQWTQKASIPNGARNSASAFSYQHKGYLIFGTPEYSGLPDRKDFWEYDPSVDQWKQLPDFEGKGRYNAKVLLREDNLYVVGGLSFYDHFPPDLWKYNFATKVWSFIGEIDFTPQAIYAHQNDVYVISVHVDYFGNFELLNFQFDPDTNTRLKDGFIFPGLPRDRTTFSTVFDDALYLGLGIDELGPDTENDCMTDIWKLELKYY